MADHKTIQHTIQAVRQFFYDAKQPRMWKKPERLLNYNFTLGGFQLNILDQIWNQQIFAHQHNR